MASSLSALLKKSTLDDHEQLLEASNRALKSSSSDSQAQHVKIVALLKLDRYDEAVQFIHDAGKSLQEEVELEYAYALYKIGRLEEAASLASKIQNRGAQHIEAQARYRLEDSKRTSELYKRIRGQPYDSEDYDLRVNQGAIDAQAQWLGLADAKATSRPSREDLDAFETAYNTACGSIARGELAQAEILLKRAKELCKHSEDLAEQQKVDELLPISVQQIYVYLSLGKTAEAESLVKEITIANASDMSTRKVGENNILLTSSLDNPFAAHKAFNSVKEVPQDDRLFSYQSVPLQSNKAALDLQSFKYDGIISSTSRIISKHPAPTLSTPAVLASQFNASAHAKNSTGKAAIKKILPELEKRPNDVGLIITLAQLYVLVGDSTSAVELVQTFFQRLEKSVAENEQDTRFNPILVSLYISLLKARGQKSQIKQELAKAAAYWRTKSSPAIGLLTAAGISLLESQSEEEVKAASEIFEKLREQQPDDKATIAGYVASHANRDSESIKGDADKLTPISELIRNIDVDALERIGIPQSSNALAIAQLTRAKKRGASDGPSSKAKRVRKSKLPKDFDATKKVDPERWLPMKDRSYYRPPKGKKKGKRGGDDKTQGGVVNEELNIDAKPATTVVTSGGAGASKKKKGKGKK
jgi:signal recognition particle subunit SRP72